MERVPVYMLAGGASSRFGADKARAELHGKTLLECAAAPFLERGHALTIVADRADRYADLGYRTIGDLDRGADGGRGLGPLAGIDTALADLAAGDARSEWALITAVDFVGVEAAWVDRLLAARTIEAPAVAFRGERWEPLFALYARSCRPHLAPILSAEDRTAWRLLEQVGAIAVPLPADWSRARSIDTPEALSLLRSESPHSHVPSGGPPATETTA